MAFRKIVAWVAGIVMHGAASCAPAQSLSGDSAVALTLFRESASAAIAAPVSAPHRIDLLRRIAAEQVKLGDDTGALETAAALGDWRFEIRTDIACRLLEDRRFDDAYRFAASAPRATRDWEVAHIAAQLPRPPFARRVGRVDTVDTAALVRRAFTIAREVQLPEARVDAYLAIAHTSRFRGDTASSVQATHAAQTALHSVRDNDFIVSRRTSIAGHLAAARRIDDAIGVIRSLPFEERLQALWFAGEDIARDPRMRQLIRAQVAALPDVPNANARAHHAWQLYWSLRNSGDSAEASALSERYPPLDPSSGQPWVQQRFPADDVAPLVRAKRLGAALEAIEKITDPLRVGFRARAYLELVDEADGQSRDTVRIALRRASEIARATSLSDTLRDRLLADVAGAQLSRGFHDDGLETVASMRIADAAAAALGAAANPPGGGTISVRGRHAVIARVANPEARALAFSSLIERSLNQGSPSSEDAALLAALADSLPQGSAREQAQVAVARWALARGDTVAARSRLMALLPTHQPSLARSSFFRSSPEHPLLNVLVRLRADDDVLSWARGIRDPVVRASALLTVGQALLARGHAPKEWLFSNGPDMCRDVF